MADLPACPVCKMELIQRLVHELLFFVKASVMCCYAQSTTLAGLLGAGAAHSACLDGSGAVLAWRSADPKLQVQEVGGALAGKRVLAISAGDSSGAQSDTSSRVNVFPIKEKVCLAFFTSTLEMSPRCGQWSDVLGVLVGRQVSHSCSDGRGRRVHVGGLVKAGRVQQRP